VNNNISEADALSSFKIDTEDGGVKFLWNFDIHVKYYRVSAQEAIILIISDKHKCLQQLYVSRKFVKSSARAASEKSAK
jgi:hypothetical protein